MAAGDAHEADTAVYVIDSVVRGHLIYKSVWSPVIGEELSLQKEHGNPHDDFAVAIIKNHQVVGHVVFRGSCFI